MTEYTDKLSAEDQVDMEERIAAEIFDVETCEPHARLDEDACARLGRSLLLIVLSEFRPDLFRGA